MVVDYSDDCCAQVLVGESFLVAQWLDSEMRVLINRFRS